MLRVRFPSACHQVVSRDFLDVVADVTVWQKCRHSRSKRETGLRHISIGNDFGDSWRTVVQLVNASKTGQIQPVEACASTSSVNSSEGFFQL